MGQTKGGHLSEPEPGMSASVMERSSNGESPSSLKCSTLWLSYQEQETRNKDDEAETMG